MFDFSIITQWFDQLLRVTVGCPDWLAILIECVLWSVRSVPTSSAVSARCV